VNRYIGNTGKFLRVDEEVRDASALPGASPRAERARQSPFGGFGGLGGLGGFSLPFGLELSDITLLLIFLFLFLESGEEEFLILLGALALAG
jgi:hypothetical protein